MRSVTSRAPFRFKGSMFVGEWTLFISVTLNTSCIRAGGEPGLLELKTAMRIMAITALHRSFQNLMVEWFGKIRFRFAVATHAELRFGHFQQFDR